MTSNSEDPHAGEIERIRLEYERRARVLPDAASPLWAVNLFYHGQTARQCVRALQREDMLPLNGRRAADIGCGSGLWLLEFLRWGAACEDLAGVDLDETRIEQARKRLPDASLHCADATHLPWPSASLDLVSQFTMFTSILSDSVRRSVAAEMIRVVKPGGRILWYDFCYNNPRNPNVRGISQPEVRKLFPNCSLSFRKLTLAPPVARLVVPISWTLALMLESLPLLRTHCLAVIRPTGMRDSR